MEPRALRRRAAAAVAAVVLVLLAAGGYLMARGRRAVGGAPAPRPAVVAPPGVRIKVEVLNATRTRRLGQRATRYLRDRGFDVVEVGTSGRTLDSVLVIDRSRHPEWARLVASALGGARVEERPDSSRYLDVTVLVGAAWRPPAEPLYP